jgi:hypothetical protein
LHYPSELHTEPTAELAVWRRSVLKSLKGLKDAIDACRNNLSIAERARIIFTSAVFIGQDNFTDEDCKTMAEGMSFL